VNLNIFSRVSIFIPLCDKIAINSLQSSSLLLREMKTTGKYTPVNKFLRLRKSECKKPAAAVAFQQLVI
jgi:hypothetical protein